MDWTLDQLVTLDAVVRTGSFSGAASELHRVPSAISYTIRNLEDALGVALFDRSGRKAVLTPAGARVLEEGRALLDQARGMAHLAHQLRGGWEPVLRVVVDGALPLEPFMAALAALEGDGIPTRVSVFVEYQEGVVERFADEDAHLMAHIGFADDTEAARYQNWWLPPLPMRLVCGAQHPLASREGLTTADTSGSTELVVRDSSRRKPVDLRRSFSDSQHVVFLSDFHAKRLALLAGSGFGWMPLHLIEADLQAGQLMPLVVDGRSEWTYTPAVSARAGSAVLRGAQTFLDSLGLAEQKS